MITKEQLKQDLLRLGVQKGDVLYIKASYKSIGKVDGGPLTVIDAICETVGNEGTVIFSAFSFNILFTTFLFLHLLNHNSIHIKNYSSFF